MHSHVHYYEDISLKYANIGFGFIFKMPKFTLQNISKAQLKILKTVAQLNWDAIRLHQTVFLAGGGPYMKPIINAATAKP